MGADLVSLRWSRRDALVVQEDCIVVVEHGGARDRLRKILFDRVESLIVWRTIPWGRIILAGLLLLGPALLLLTAREELARGMGYAILGAAVFVEGRYLYDRLTHIRIRRAGKRRDLRVIARPSKVRRVLDKIRRSIEATQAHEIARAEEREAEQAGHAAGEVSQSET